MTSEENEFDEVIDLISKIKKEYSDGNYIFRGVSRDHGIKHDDGESEYNSEDLKKLKVSSSLFRFLYKELYSDLEEDNKGNLYKTLPLIEKESINRIKRQFPQKYKTNIDVLTDLRHYDDNVNIIDFTKDFNIALFFACYSEHKEDGELLILNIKDIKEEDDIDYEKSPSSDKSFILLKPSEHLESKQRVQSQKSIFVFPTKGFLESKNIKIKEIPLTIKQKTLEYLKTTHKIDHSSIYNDIWGSIQSEKNFRKAKLYAVKGYYQSHAKNHKEAINLYNKAIDLDPNYTSAYCHRAFSREKLGDIQGVKDDYDKTIKLNPNDALAHYNRGILKAKEFNDPQSALEDYNKAIELDPKFILAYNNRGSLKVKLDNLQEALEDYNKAIELDPNNTSAYCSRALLKKSLGNYQGALEDYNKAIKLNPKYAFAYYNRGLLKAKLNDPQSTLKNYNKIIKLNPKFVLTFNNQEFLNIKLNDPQGALEDYSKAIELNPNYAPAYYNRGLLKVILKDFQGALEDYNKAIELDPNYILAYCGRATLKMENFNNYQKALEDYSNAIELDPNDAPSYYGRSILKTKEFDDIEGAKRDYKRARELNPSLPKIQELEELLT